jgi:hypothetical protein
MNEVTVNTKLSKGTKKANNKLKCDRIEDKIINKIDKYKTRKEMRNARRTRKQAA